MKKKLTAAAMIPVYLAVCAAILVLTAAGSKTVTVMAMSAPVPDRHCIIIDAGHGDPDGIDKGQKWSGPNRSRRY